MTKSVLRKRNARRQSGCLRSFINNWGEKRRQRQGRKGTIYPTGCRVQRTAKRYKKAFLNEQCKEIEDNNRLGKTRDLIKKFGDIKGTSHARMGTVKDRNGGDQTEQKRLRRGGKNTKKNCSIDMQMTPPLWQKVKRN